MFWVPIAIPVIAAAAYAIYESLESETRRAREQWELERVRIYENINELRHRVAVEKENAEKYDNFKVLAALHRQSYQLANEAYKARKNASAVIQSLYDAIRKAKAEKNRVYDLLQNRSLPLDERKALNEEFDLYKAIISDSYDKVNATKQECEEFNNRVHSFNSNTHDLKLFIRDNCGKGGQLWYARLEQRIAAKRSSD